MLEAENAELRERVRVLEAQLAAVIGKIAELEKQMARNSSNSSKPPSSDPGPAKTDRPENANRAARRAMGRKQGKQPGTPGFTLSQIPDPDVVVTHSPTQCRGCDRSLDDAEVTGTSTRQVFDIPDPKVVVTEHRAEKRRCVCGCETVGVFPPEATAPACYGPGIKAHAVYLIAAQHLPRQRGALALHDLFKVTVSTGTLDNWIRDAHGGPHQHHLHALGRISFSQQVVADLGEGIWPVGRFRVTTRIGPRRAQGSGASHPWRRPVKVQSRNEAGPPAQQPKCSK